jgi:hypothetical protein
MAVLEDLLEVWPSECTHVEAASDAGLKLTASEERRPDLSLTTGLSIDICSHCSMITAWQMNFFRYRKVRADWVGLGN